MQKIYDYIFNLSPKKLAIYLILGPLLLFLVHTVTSITFRALSETSPINETFIHIILGILYIFLGVFVFLWIFWLRSTVFSVNEKDLGLNRKLFQIAYIFLLLFILFNVGASILEYVLASDNWNDDYMYLMYSSREFINFGGIIIAYPIVCHYAASAVTVRRRNQAAIFVNTLPYTLLLIFGAMIGIPLLHKYFSQKTSTKSQIIIIYAIAFSLCVVIFVIGFIAAITGLV